MKSLKRLKIIILAICAMSLAACDEEGEQVVPMPQNVTEALFDSCVNGKGWINVSSREVKQNGTLAKEEYWSNPDAGKPQQYLFCGDTLTTFLSTDAYDAEVYQESRYAYQPADHRLISSTGEVFKLISVSAEELCVLQYKGFSGNGEKIYVYSIYRPMSVEELASCREEHPYNLATINADCPTLPEQAAITLEFFKENAVNSGWKCAEAHRMTTSNRYAAANSVAADKVLSLGDIYITADSLILLKRGITRNVASCERQKYSFRANSFSLCTDTGASLRILSLTADEMLMLISNGTDGQRQGYNTYCIYKRMTADEASSAFGNSAFNAAAGN